MKIVFCESSKTRPATTLNRIIFFSKEERNTYITYNGHPPQISSRNPLSSAEIRLDQCEPDIFFSTAIMRHRREFSTQKTSSLFCTFFARFLLFFCLPFSFLKKKKTPRFSIDVTFGNSWRACVHIIRLKNTVIERRSNDALQTERWKGQSCHCYLCYLHIISKTSKFRKPLSDFTPVLIHPLWIIIVKSI